MGSRRAADWALIGALALSFAAFFLISRVHAYRARCTLASYQRHPSRFPSEYFFVEIEGAVSRPGKYRLRKGDPLSKALQKSHPKPYANLRSFNLEDPVLSSLKLVIEPLSEITVFLRLPDGSLQTLLMPARSRICDLKSKIPMTKPELFRSKRLLKDGEIFVLSTN